MRISDWSSDVCSSDLFTIGYQLVDGYTNIEPLLYAKGLGLQLASFVLMAALAVFFQVATGNMFVGYVLMIAYLVLRVVVGMYDFDHVLYNYGRASPTPYSDMNGYRSEEHTSELQSLMRISYAVFCLKKKNNNKKQ